MKAWEVAESGGKPIVTYRCIASSRGTTLGATFADEGRPVFAWWGPADTSPAPARWFGDGALDESVLLIDELGDPDIVPLHCHRHGYWLIPRTEMLEHFKVGRQSRPYEIKLDQASAWFHGEDDLALH